MTNSVQKTWNLYQGTEPKQVFVTEEKRRQFVFMDHINCIGSKEETKTSYVQQVPKDRKGFPSQICYFKILVSKAIKINKNFVQMLLKSDHGCMAFILFFLFSKDGSILVEKVVWQGD